MEQQKFLGIEIGGTKLQIVSGYGDGTILSAHPFVVDKKQGATGIRNTIETVLKEYPVNEIAAIGVGFGGPVNRLTGKIETSFHIEGWSGFDIRHWLLSMINVPVFIENDGNVAALAEATLGVGQSYHTMLYITIGSGVGGGLVIDKKIYHGASPGEIEIGHLQMDRKGTTLQDCCSGWAVDEKIRAAIVSHPGCVLAKLLNGKQTAEAMFLKEALNANDGIATEIFEQTTDDLAFGLSHAIHLLHPDIIVLGGGLSFLGDVLETSLTKKISGYLMKAFVPSPPVRLSLLKEKAVPVGALVLCQQNL